MVCAPRQARALGRLVVSVLGKVEKYIVYSVGVSEFFFIHQRRDGADWDKDAYLFEVGAHWRVYYY